MNASMNNKSPLDAEALIEVKHLSFNRGERVIYDDVSLKIRRGQITAIMGPSGTGKTTLLRLIGGQLVPDRGEVLLDGKNIELELQVAPDLQLQLNPVLLQMVLTNLLQNAFLHSAAGTIYISANSEQLLIRNPLQDDDQPTELTALFAKGRQSSKIGDLTEGYLRACCYRVGIILILKAG